MRWIIAIILAVAAVSPASAQRDQDEESQLLEEEARRALAKKDYPRAGALLDKALRVSPRRIDLYVLRASIHGVVGEHDQAVALLERARKLAPDTPAVLIALGTQLVEAGRAKDGVPLLESMVKRDASRYDAQVVLGHHYVKTGEWRQGAEAFAAYFVHRPGALAGEDALHRLDQAEAVMRSGNARAALTLYKQVLAADAKDEKARLGVAWATAATSCKQAMTVLDGMIDLEAKHPEVLLVRGRCALMLGRVDEALGRAERFRKAQPDAVAGWMLLGEVRVAQRNWKEAEVAFQRALDRAPEDKVIALQLGRTERLLGKHAAAGQRLKAAGAPVGYEDDWTLEYGEVLLALREAAPLRDHLAPWIKGHERNATGQFLYGSSLAMLGDHAGAVPYLDRGAQGGEPRAARVLIDALNTLAAAAVKKGDLDDAARLLAQAEGAGGGPLTARNLGAVLVAQGHADQAVAVIEKSGDKNDAVTLHLLARSYHGAKRWDDARASYARAIKAYGKEPRAVAAWRDLANAELAAGRGEEAVAALDAAIAASPAAAKRELEAARLAAARAAATDAMRGGKFASAVKILKSVEKAADGEALVQLRCDLALAATGATQRELALDLLRALERSKAKCPFAPPADELGVPILIAWNEGATLRRARKALERLETLKRKATGVAEPLLRQAAGDIALRAAAEAYSSDGGTRAAAAFLAKARLHDKRSPELAHNQAVIDIASGSVDNAIAVLEGLVNEVPEARINLGLAYEKKGDPQKALAAWKAALAAGVRHPALEGWIEAKQRFWGGQ